MASKKTILDEAKSAKYTAANYQKLIKLLKTQMKKSDPDFVPKVVAMTGSEAFIPLGDIGQSSNTVSGFNELRLNLLSLKNIESVGWEITDWGIDKIVMGGLGADSSGQSIQVNQFNVGDYDEGDRKDFNPARRFVSFNLNHPGTWPRIFNVTMLCGKKDASGGFIEFLQQLWEIVDEIVVELITAAVAAGIGAAIGTAIEPGVGTVIGLVVGAVIGFIVSWVMDSLKDDIFDPVVTSLLLPDANARFENNSTKSTELTTQFTRSGGIYELTYQWELV